jgi:hypothetical protein
MLKCILENLYELYLDLHFLFIDFNQTYDSIGKTHFYEILKESRTSKKLVNLIRMKLLDSDGKVNTQGQLTEETGKERGLRQGDALSTTLFNSVLEKVTWNIETNPNGKIFNSTRHYVAYADDVLILGRSTMASEVVIQI